VLATLSPGFRESCDTMINRWASDGHPQNKPLLTVRDLGRPDGASGRFLALRCSFTLPWSERVFDERLAYPMSPRGTWYFGSFPMGRTRRGVLCSQGSSLLRARAFRVSRSLASRLRNRT
jgi:hypothetical protein